MTKVRAPPEVMVQTPMVAEVNVTVRLESEVAVNVGVVPKFCVPGLVNVMVWGALGVTEFEADEAEPVPAALVAVTVNVYAVPLVRPVTVIGLVAEVPVAPPGFAVAV